MEAESQSNSLVVLEINVLVNELVWHFSNLTMMKCRDDSVLINSSRGGMANKLVYLYVEENDRSQKLSNVFKWLSVKEYRVLW